MSQETGNLEPQPSSAPPLTDEEREAELKKIEEELKHDEEVKEEEMKAALEKAKAMREQHQKTLLLEMIEIARRLNLDSLKFSSLETIVHAIGLEKCQICTHCFDGSSFHSLEEENE